MEGGSLFNPGFLGGHFLWWVGQIADDSVWRGNRNSDKFQKASDIPGWGRRYKVRIIGLHDKEEQAIPSDQLPWAQVMYPVTSGGGQAGSFQTPALKQGNFVFGFFLDGQDQQVPVIMGILGNNEQTALQMKTGLSGGDNFKGTSGHANQSQDETKITGDKDLKTEQPQPETSAAKEAGGGDDHQENAADKKEEEVLDRKHALSCPDPEENSSMKGIRTVIENLQKKIEKFQKAMKTFSEGVSLKIKDISKDIDKAIEDASKEISKFMKDIYTRIQEWMTDQFNKKIKPLLKISIPSFRIKLLELNVKGLETICCLFNKLAGALAGLIAAALGNRLNNQKEQSPSEPPAFTSPGSEVVPPLPPENYYRPVTLCSAEELVADVLSGTINEMMQVFDSAVAPVIYEVQNSLAAAGVETNIGSSGSGTVANILNQQPDVVGNIGSLSGLNMDIGAAMSFISSLTSLFDCDPKPKCSPNDTHTLQEGGNANPGVEKPSLGNVAQKAIQSLEKSAAANPIAQATASSFDKLYATPPRTIQPGEGGGA